MNLPRWALRFPVTVSMVLISMLVLGGLSARKLPLAFLPEVDFPGVEVNIPYPNALPAQVEEEITRPVEEALSTMSGIRHIYSFSSANQCHIWMEMDWGVEIGPVRVEAREKIDRIRDELPVDVDLIQVNSFRSSDIPVLVCRISADRDLSSEYELLDRHLADPLRRVPGVAQVQIYGVEPPQVLIDLRMDDLQRHGIEAAPLLARLEASSQSLSSGQLRYADAAWPLRVVNRFESLEAIENFPVNGEGLRLSDIADVRYEEPEMDHGRHLDDTRAIGLEIVKESGANTVEVARGVRRVLGEVGEDPVMQGIQVLTFFDQADDITNSISGLRSSGIIGALLAIGILFFFLRHFTATAVVAATIPFSLLASAAVLYFTGRTLNILTMMGLMLAVGLVVDNAVVVLESIYRFRQKGMSPLHAALKGSQEVLPAVFTATATSVIVFLPLVLGGRTEVTTWIGEVARVIMFTLGASLFLSLTFIPLAMGRWIPGKAPRSNLLTGLSSRYERVLGWTLRHRVATLAIAFGVVVVSMVPFSMVDKSAFTGTRVEAVNMRYDFADNVNWREAERYVTAVERWIHERQDSLHIRSTYSYFTDNFAITRAYLTPGYADTDGAQEVRDLMRGRLPELPGVKLDLGGDDDGGGGREKLRVRLYGDPGPRMDDLAEEVRRRLSLVDGLADVSVGGRESNAKEIEVAVKGEEAAMYGLTTQDVASNVALFFRGRSLARYKGPDGEVEVKAQLRQEDRKSLDRLRELPLVSSDEGVVPLASVADFRTVDTPGRVFRQERRSVKVVSANLAGSKFGQVRKTVSREMDAIHFPPGYSWSYGSFFQEEDATAQELLINLMLALCLVYLVMAGLFESLTHPLAIMLALPFALVGVAWISFLTGSPFNLMAQIGMLILIGIVVNNGIVLIYHVFQLRQRGLDRNEAIRQAARDRLRPILMTTATTVLGLLPLAVGQNRVGDILYFPLARTVIGGLTASTILTLVLVPCLYTLIEDFNTLVKRLWKFGPKAGAPA